MILVKHGLRQGKNESGLVAEIEDREGLERTGFPALPADTRDLMNLHVIILWD
jgi:hypothetical protein